MRVRGGNGDGIIGQTAAPAGPPRHCRLDTDDIGGDKGAVPYDQRPHCQRVVGAGCGALRAAKPAIANPGGAVISTFDTPTSIITLHSRHQR